MSMNWRKWLFKLHTHNFVFINRLRYRNADRKEYVMEVYRCECGAGHFIKTPAELYHTDMHPA
jgi:hypothetical protein